MVLKLTWTIKIIHDSEGGIEVSTSTKDNISLKIKECRISHIHPDTPSYDAHMGFELKETINNLSASWFSKPELELKEKI